MDASVCVSCCNMRKRAEAHTAKERSFLALDLAASLLQAWAGESALQGNTMLHGGQRGGQTEFGDARGEYSATNETEGRTTVCKEGPVTSTE